MQPKQVTAMAMISGIIFLTFISMAEHNECEDKGQYRAANGFCCHLCPPGSRWLYDCFYTGDQSLCTSCMPGKEYMDVANRDPQCKKCSTCNVLYEDFQQNCTVTSDTMCQCKDGYSRPDPSQPCEVTSNTGQNITISVGIVTFILLVVMVVVVLLIYRKNKSLYPFETSEASILLSAEVPIDVLKELRMLINNTMMSSDAEVWRKLNEFLPNVYKSISENSFFILYDMHKKYNIDRFVCWKACEFADNSRRTVFIIKYFIEQGEEMCQRLLDLIHAEQDMEKQLQTLLDSAVKCSPVLNPDTAYKGLLIAADQKTATWIEDPPDKPEHPDRFDFWCNVLSTESFASGSHFWVVTVEDGDDYSIGVAYESILRKGGGSASLIGHNSMSWCLQRLKNKYWALHDKKNSDLEVGEHLRRIGVVLDYDGGVLLFYNAHNNKHLHTFYAHFSQPLHVDLFVCKGALTIELVND